MVGFLVFQYSSTYVSTEEASISGTVVYRGQNDDSDSPRTPKSRLGLQERTFSAALEDSELNLAEVGILFLNFSMFTVIPVRFCKSSGLIFLWVMFASNSW